MFRTSIVHLQERSYAVCCNLVCLDTSCCYEGERRTALQSSALTVSPLSHLPSPVPTKSNLNLADSLPTAISDPDLCPYIKFLVPNFMSNLLCWEVIQKGLSTSCCNILQHAEFFLRCGDFVPSFNHQSGGPPFFSSPLLLIYISNYPPYPEDCLYSVTIYWHYHKYYENYKTALSMFGHVSTFSTIYTRSVLLSVS